MPNSDFEPLTHVLEDWFACSFDDISEAVRAQIPYGISLRGLWDKLSEEQRRAEASNWDATHDPAHEQEGARAWDMWCELDGVRREIGEWDALRPQSITEKAEQANQLHALWERERQLLEELNSPAPPAASEQAGPLQSRQRYQEQEILRVLRELGHDPHRLPDTPDGKSGPKAHARAKCPKMSRKVFDKAWQRLRDDGEIGP